MNKNLIYTSKKQVSLNLRKQEVSLKAMFPGCPKVLEGSTMKLQGEPLTQPTWPLRNIYSLVYHRPLQTWSLKSGHFHWIATLLLGDNSPWITSSGTDCLLEDACRTAMEMRRTDDVSLQSKGQDCLVFSVINISGSSEGRHDHCPFKGVRDPKLGVPFL